MISPKKSLAVASEMKSCKSLSYDHQGLSELLKIVALYDDPVVVCEATGGYERTLVAWMHEKGIAVAMVNPGRVRDFARSDGIKAKTDPIDAAAILRFAQQKQIQPTPPPSVDQQELEALMDRRAQLSEALAREKNRQQMATQYILASIEEMIRLIEKEIASIDARIKRLIAENETMRRQDEIMQAIVGVGPISSWSILAYMPEITTLGRNQVVALAGIAPFNKDSGLFKGKRKIQGGRAKVRRCLHMAARSAAVHNDVIRPYVAQLRERGKAYKSAITAASRKILIHIQSLLKHDQFSLA